MVLVRILWFYCIGKSYCNCVKLRAIWRSQLNSCWRCFWSTIDHFIFNCVKLNTLKDKIQPESSYEILWECLNHFKFTTKMVFVRQEIVVLKVNHFKSYAHLNFMILSNLKNLWPCDFFVCIIFFICVFHHKQTDGIVYLIEKKANFTTKRK